MKEATSFRLSPESLELLRELSEETSLSQADIIERALRMFAKSQLRKELKK